MLNCLNREEISVDPMGRFLASIAIIVFVFLISSGCNPLIQEINPTQLASITQESQNSSNGESIVNGSMLPPMTLSPIPILPTSTLVLSATPTPTETPKPRIPMPLMGVEVHRPEPEKVLSLLSDSGSQIVRYGSVIWYDVEPKEGQYNWAALQEIDSALQKVAANDTEIILIVRGTPRWAQKVKGSACGPITQEKFVAFANFMTELVRRYSGPPYDVKYWEIGNEPDIATELVGSKSGFGCWGDSQDIFYGGSHYAEMLKVVYPAIKNVDPDAQVMIGGLLMDCDPDYPPEEKDCLSTRFFEGILAAEGADFFDFVNFHGYLPYTQQSLSLEFNFPGWKDRGGIVVGKVNYLRDTMQEYGVQKPIFLTESSLNCPDWNSTDCSPPGELFFDTQADYVVRLFVRNWAMDIAGSIWFQFEGQGWRYSNLVGNDMDNPNPAYQSFKYLNEKLENTVFIGQTPFPDGLEGYIFSGVDYQTWVIWSKDGSSQIIELPQSILSVYDKFGQEIALQELQITVNSPIYLDISQ